jgi:hypothetical protein
LIVQERINGSGGGTSSQLLFNAVGLLFSLLLLQKGISVHCIQNHLKITYSSGLTSLLLTEGNGVVGFVPLTERSGINLDDGTLDESVGTDQFVVGGVVNDSQDTSLAGDTLGTPGEVTGLETESTTLEVTTADTNQVNTLGTQLGVGRLTTQLEPFL